MASMVNTDLLARLQGDPSAHVDLIVTVKGDPNHYLAQVQAFGLEVKRTFSLTQKLAVAGPCQAFVALSQKDWVQKIEEDKPVKVMR